MVPYRSGAGCRMGSTTGPVRFRGALAIASAVLATLHALNRLMRQRGRFFAIVLVRYRLSFAHTRTPRCCYGSLRPVRSWDQPGRLARCWNRRWGTIVLFRAHR